MDTTATIIIALFAVSISALVVIRLNNWPHTQTAWRRLKLAWREYRQSRDELTYGDVAFIPEGMAATRKVRGGETASSSGRLQQDVIARRHESGL